MIFPLVKENDLTDFQMLPYHDDPLIDPDPLGNWTLHDLVHVLPTEDPDEGGVREDPSSG